MRITFAKRLVAVTCALVVTQSALAFYNPSTGRWLNRDPLASQSPLLENASISEDSTSSNPELAPTLFVLNSPNVHFDSLGLWPSSNPFLAKVVGLSFPLTHQNSIDRTIPSWIPDPASAKSILDVATRYMDKDQSTDGSYKHAMKAPNQEIADARMKANEWVKAHIENAQKELCQSCRVSGKALYEFGLALHTVQDSTSPAHYGFQTWRGLIQHPLEARNHAIEEAFDPGFGSQLDGATLWLWSFFRCKDSAPPLPLNFFSQWYYDSGTWPPSL